MAAKTKAAPASNGAQSPIEKAREARKASGSRLPEAERIILDRLGDINKMEGELSDAVRNEKKALISQKKQLSFSRLAKKYLKNALREIDRIKGLASSSYVSTPEQVQKIESMLTNAVASCLSAYDKNASVEAEDFDL